MKLLKKIIKRTHEAHTRGHPKHQLPPRVKEDLARRVSRWSNRPDSNHTEWISYGRHWRTTGDDNQHWAYRNDKARRFHQKIEKLLEDHVYSDFSMHPEMWWPITGWMLSQILLDVPPRTNMTWNQ
jgi:hypothetical protein